MTTSMRQLRQELKRTQREIADIVGKSRPLISMYESGRAVPPIGVAYNILRFAGRHDVQMSLDEFYHSYQMRLKEGVR